MEAIISADETMPALEQEDVFVSPASFAQRRLWFLHQLDPASTAYNMTGAVRLEGRLDFAALERSFNEIVRRHESLRTSFKTINEELMQVVTPHQPLHIDRIDLRFVPDDEREEETRRQIRAASQRPFDFEKSETLRVSLLDLSDRESVMVVVMNHINSDGWSLGVLVKEMVVLYEAFTEGKPSPLPALGIQYLDFAQWQREWLTGSVREKQLDYWKRKLSGKLPVLELSGDVPRQTTRTFQGATELVRLPSELSKQINELGRERRVTAFMTFLTAFQILLHRYTGLDDILVGTPVAGRTRPETQNLIGFFVNTLVMRTDLAGDPRFADLLARVREATLEAQKYSDLPFEVLVEELQPERNLSHAQIFQVMFAMQNTPLPDMNLKDLRVSLLDVEETTAKFDLMLELREDASGFTGAIHYSTERFTRARIQQIVGHLRQLLEGIVANPETHVAELPLLTAGERQQILSEWNETERDYPVAGSMLSLFQAQAQQTPDAIALSFETEQISYRELDERSNRLAHHLRERGIGVEQVVGVLSHRTPELIVTLLAILKTGAAYLPLDPAYPTPRLQLMLEGSEASLLITTEALAHLVPDVATPLLCLDTESAAIASRPATTLQEVKLDAENLAYLIYTSGSTGHPKPVGITHRSALTFLHWAREVFSTVEFSGMLASTSVCFDLSVFELFAPLSWGGEVILVNNALELATMTGRERVRVINTVPSAMAELVRLRAVPEGVLTVNLAGEALSRTLVQEIYEQTGVKRVLNLYGPSEDTTYSTWTEVARGSTPTIGRPIANTQAYILDRELQPVPVGVAGELYLGGDGLARGYLGRPEQTAEKFVPHPFSGVGGERLYRTGDLSRWLANGEIEFLGRIDNQVKLRGFRIELGEIEAVLGQHESVRACVVVAQQDASGDQRLVAYVVPEEETIETMEVRQYLGERLPVYMIPSLFVSLESLPLLSNGKVDRKALPAPEEIIGAAEREYVAPRTPVEEILAGIWAEVLKVDRVGINDNFFDLGGHSLLATRVVSRVNEIHPQAVSLRNFFEKSTLAEFAFLIEQAQPVKSDTTPIITAQPHRRKNRAWLLENLAQLSDEEAREILTQRKQSIN